MGFGNSNVKIESNERTPGIRPFTVVKAVYEALTEGRDAVLSVTVLVDGSEYRIPFWDPTRNQRPLELRSKATVNGREYQKGDVLDGQDLLDYSVSLFERKLNQIFEIILTEVPTIVASTYGDYSTKVAGLINEANKTKSGFLVLGYPSKGAGTSAVKSSYVEVFVPASGTFVSAERSKLESYADYLVKTRDAFTRPAPDQVASPSANSGFSAANSFGGPSSEDDTTELPF